MYSSPAFWALCFLSLVFVLPTIIGLIRRVDNIGILIMLNLLGIPTLLAGWVVAMLMACFWSRRPKPLNIRQFSPAPQPPRMDYDPGPMRGTPFESVARAGFWADQPERRAGA